MSASLSTPVQHDEYRYHAGCGLECGDSLRLHPYPADGYGKDRFDHDELSGFPPWSWACHRRFTLGH